MLLHFVPPAIYTTVIAEKYYKDRRHHFNNPMLTMRACADDPTLCDKIIDELGLDSLTLPMISVLKFLVSYPNGVNEGYEKEKLQLLSLTQQEFDEAFDELERRKLIWNQLAKRNP